MDYTLSLYAFAASCIVFGTIYFLLARYWRFSESRREYGTLEKVVTTFHTLLTVAYFLLATFSLLGAILGMSEDRVSCEYQIANETVYGNTTSYEYSNPCTDAPPFARQLFTAYVYAVILPSIFVYGVILVYWFILSLRRAL